MLKKFTTITVLLLVVGLAFLFVGCEPEEEVVDPDVDEEEVDEPEPEVDFPTETIHAHVGWSEGGASDTITRALVHHMEDYMDETIMVSNTDGALGSIAGTRALGDPSGHTWMGGASVHGTWQPLGFADHSWDDFYAFLGTFFPTTIYVRADQPYDDLDELLDAIAENPEEYKYGSPGAGSNGEIFGDLVLDAAGIEGVEHIPYDGGREAHPYLERGEVDFISVTMGDVLDYVEAGELIPLANLYDEDIEAAGVEFPRIGHWYPDLEDHIGVCAHFGIYVPREVDHDVLMEIYDAFAYAVEQERYYEISVEDRGGVIMPLVGQPSDEFMAGLESARSWPLWEMGIAEEDPAEFGIPRVEDFEWPPHDRAAEAREWPAELQDGFIGQRD